MKMNIAKLEAKAKRNANKSKHLYGNIKIKEVMNKIKVVDLSDWNESHKFMTDEKKEVELKKWCKKYDVHRYSAKQENFKLSDAVGQAKVIKKKAILINIIPEEEKKEEIK